MENSTARARRRAARRSGGFSCTTATAMGRVDVYVVTRAPRNVM